MKIVIDIPKDRYKDIQRIALVQLEYHHFKTAEQIIANGTPQPEERTVEPERKTGKWIRGEAYPHHIYCSECYKTFIPNDEFRVWANGDIPRKYCPNCGSRMEVDNGQS